MQDQIITLGDDDDFEDVERKYNQQKFFYDQNQTNLN